MNIAFFETNHAEEKYLQKKIPEHSLIFLKEPLTEKNVAQVKHCDVVSIFIYSHITPIILQQLPRLRAVITRSTGFDHIELTACKQKSIGVYHVAHYSHTVAEHTFALMLALSRNLSPSVERVKKGIFSYRDLEGFDLNGKTIGIIGLGKIGKWVACIATAFGMNVLAYDICRDDVFAKKQNISYCSLNYLLHHSDIVSLHCNLTKENKHVLNAEKISLMKKNALLINTARGGLIKTSALLSALRRKKIAGAGLDVLEEEYLPDLQRKKILKELTKYSNVVITPHNAFNSTEAVQKIFDVTINTIRHITHTLPMENRVI